MSNPWQRLLWGVPLALIGVFVLLVSLQAMQARAAGAREAERQLASPEPKPATMKHWLDRDMPGTLPYLVDRSLDKSEEMLSDPNKRGEVLLHRAIHRAQRAQYAQRMGDSALARETLGKAVVYLSRGMTMCRQFECDEQQMLDAYRSVHQSAIAVQAAHTNERRSEIDAQIAQISAIVSSQ